MEELLGALLAGAAERPSDQAPPPAQMSLPLFLFSLLSSLVFASLRFCRFGSCCVRGRSARPARETEPLRGRRPRRLQLDPRKRGKARFQHPTVSCSVLQSVRQSGPSGQSREKFLSMRTHCTLGIPSRPWPPCCSWRPLPQTAFGDTGRRSTTAAFIAVCRPELPGNQLPACCKMLSRTHWEATNASCGQQP